MEIMVALAVIAGALKWWSSHFSKSQVELRFEETPEPAIFALDLHRDGQLIDTAVQQ